MAPIPKLSTPSTKGKAMVSTTRREVTTTQTPIARPKQMPNPPQKKKKRKQRGNSYASTIINPFANISAHIPDDKTTLSGLITSTAHLRLSFPILNASTSSEHKFGIVMMPYPGCAWSKLVALSNSTDEFSDTGLTGTSVEYSKVPNWQSIYGATDQSAKVRCVSMGIRIIYEGTELNRSGRIFAGQGVNADVPRSLGVTGTQISPVSCITGTVKPTLTELRSCLTNVTESRVSDGVFAAHWLPAGTPSYQLFGQTTNGSTATVSGAAQRDTIFQCAAGDAGCESGQNFLVLVVENDTTAASINVSNTYAFELVWNWEVVPDDTNTVAYNLSPSRMDMASLQSALNLVQTAPTGGYTRTATNRGTRF